MYNRSVCKSLHFKEDFQLKKKFTVITLVLAMSLQLAIPAVTSAEKSDKQTDLKTDIKTDITITSDKDTENDLKEKTETTAIPEKPDLEATAAPDKTSEPTDAEASPSPSLSPYKKFRNTGALSAVTPSPSETPKIKPSSDKPEISVKPDTSAKPSVSPQALASPSVSPEVSPSAAPVSRENLADLVTETQTKSVTGTIKNITDRKISITVSEGVTEDFIYGAPIKGIHTGDPVMITYDPKMNYAETVYKAPKDFIENVKLVDFTISQLSSDDLSDSITSGDLCSIIYNMLVYNKLAADTVVENAKKGKTTAKKSLVEYTLEYLERHPEARDQIKIVATTAPSTTRGGQLKNTVNLNELKAAVLKDRGYVSDEVLKNLDKTLTREQAAEIISELYKRQATADVKDGEAESYSDLSGISKDLQNAVTTLQKAGIMTSGGKSFKPKAEYSQADAIRDIVRIEELL